MPKETFIKLPLQKKQRIINSFLREFSLKNYDEASLSAVVKSLGIAKGSIYQYFDGKLNLFLFLVASCGEVKQQYIAHVKREGYPDFWAWFKALYEEGLKFDLEHPLMSNFLHALSKNLNAPSLKEIHAQWLEQTLSFFEEKIQAEVDQGHFRNDLPAQTMAYFLYSVSTNIINYMQAIHGLDLHELIQAGRPIFGDHRDLILLQSVDEYIQLMRSAFEKQTA